MNHPLDFGGLLMEIRYRQKLRPPLFQFMTFDTRLRSGMGELLPETQVSLLRVLQPPCAARAHIQLGP
jgi:hypothetical protein